MRTKSFAVRSSRKSLNSYPSPAASLPDEADERDVPDTIDERDVPHKKRHCLGSSEIGRGSSDPLNLDACIVCEISDKWVSRCSGNDCLVSFHGECLNTEVGGGSEDLPNTYCPYCWFNILALKYKSVREKAVVAEKAVFDYVDKEVKSRDQARESVPKSQEDKTLSGNENGSLENSVDSADIVSHDEELQGQKDDYTSSKEEQVQVEKDSDKSRDENTPLIEEIDQPVGTDNFGDMKEDKVIIEEVESSEDEEKVATESFQDAENDETDNDRTKINTGAGKKRDDSPFLSMQGSFSGKEDDQVQQKEKRRTRRRLILNAFDSDVSSNESTNEGNGEDVTDQITSSAQVTSPSGKIKLRAKSKVIKSKTVRDISFSKKDQRRRLLWTLEEEEMLKVGVERFAAETNKNMPWRKILEMGENVFHETRNPADLKDKWRNMVRRNTNKEAQ